MSRTLRQIFHEYRVYTWFYDRGAYVDVRQIVFQPRREGSQTTLLVGAALEYSPCSGRIKNVSHGAFWNLSFTVPREELFVVPKVIMMPATVHEFPKSSFEPRKSFWCNFKEISESMKADLDENYRYDLENKSAIVAKMRHKRNITMLYFRALSSAASL